MGVACCLAEEKLLRTAFIFLMVFFWGVVLPGQTLDPYQQTPGTQPGQQQSPVPLGQPGGPPPTQPPVPSTVRPPTITNTPPATQAPEPTPNDQHLPLEQDRLPQ